MHVPRLLLDDVRLPWKTGTMEVLYTHLLHFSLLLQDELEYEYLHAHTKLQPQRGYARP